MFLLTFTNNEYFFRLGPLVRSWCMRYEAKHQYFKRLAVVTGNFINLPYTLSKRHQESLSYRLMSSEGSLTSFIEKGVHIGPGKISQRMCGQIRLKNILPFFNSPLFIYLL